MTCSNFLRILAISFTILFVGCASSKVASIQGDEVEGKFRNNTLCSVTFNTGITKTFHSLHLVTGVLRTPFLLADGHLKIKGSEIARYHNGKYEAIAQESFYAKAKSKVAQKVLPGFAIKEVTGSFNLYSLEFYNNGNIIKKYFLQEGEQGAINLVDVSLFEKHFGNASDNKINKKNSRVVNAKSLIALVEGLNKSFSISKK